MSTLDMKNTNIISSSINTSDHQVNILLDTHMLLWYAEGTNLSDQEIMIMEKARKSNQLFISAITIWEIAMLVQKEKIALSIDLNEWVDKVLSLPKINLLDLSIPILLQSCNLPQLLHKDPADRMIIATARSNDLHIMTHDQKIINYAKQGYVKIAE